MTQAPRRRIDEDVELMFALIQPPRRSSPITSEEDRDFYARMLAEYKAYQRSETLLALAQPRALGQRIPIAKLPVEILKIIGSFLF